VLASPVFRGGDEHRADAASAVRLVGDEVVDVEPGLADIGVDLVAGVRVRSRDASPDRADELGLELRDQPELRRVGIDQGLDVVDEALVVRHAEVVLVEPDVVRAERAMHARESRAVAHTYRPDRRLRLSHAPTLSQTGRASQESDLVRSELAPLTGREARSVERPVA
jgi:hypothetical protein